MGEKIVTAAKIVWSCLLVMQLCLVSGCFYQDRVKHLASDVCLITPERAGKDDVIAYLGQPLITRRADDGSEIWIYYDVEKSLLRQMPFIGSKMGYEKYNVVIVTISGKTVRTCVYRYLPEEEFKRTVIEHGEQPGK